MSQADCQEADFDKETDSDLQLDSRMIMLWGESRKKALVQKSIAHFLLFCIGILMFAEIKADKTLEWSVEMNLKRREIHYHMDSIHFFHNLLLCAVFWEHFTGVIQ